MNKTCSGLEFVMFCSINSSSKWIHHTVDGSEIWLTTGWMYKTLVNNGTNHHLSTSTGERRISSNHRSSISDNPLPGSPSMSHLRTCCRCSKEALKSWENLKGWVESTPTKRYVLRLITRILWFDPPLKKWPFSWWQLKYLFIFWEDSHFFD